MTKLTTQKRLFPISEQLAVPQDPPSMKAQTFMVRWPNPSLFNCHIYTYNCRCEQSRCLAVNQPIRAELIICGWAVVILVRLGRWSWVLACDSERIGHFGKAPTNSTRTETSFPGCYLKSAKRLYTYTAIWSIFLTVIGWLSSILLHRSLHFVQQFKSPALYI